MPAAVDDVIVPSTLLVTCDMHITCTYAQILHVHSGRGGGAGQADQATAQPIFTKTGINYYLRMEICAFLAILPDQCLICQTKVQLLPPTLHCIYMYKSLELLKYYASLYLYTV